MSDNTEALRRMEAENAALKAEMLALLRGVSGSGNVLYNAKQMSNINQRVMDSITRASAAHDAAVVRARNVLAKDYAVADAMLRVIEAAEKAVARSHQPGFDDAPDDSPCTFFVKDVREIADALTALRQSRGEAE